jgi:hypothetical protein
MEGESTFTQGESTFLLEESYDKNSSGNGGCFINAGVFIFVRKTDFRG